MEKKTAMQELIERIELRGKHSPFLCTEEILTFAQSLLSKEQEQMVGAEFAEWVSINRWEYSRVNKYWEKMFETKTTAELINEFLTPKP